MKNLTSRIILLLTVLFFALGSIACNEEDSLLLSDTNPSSDKEALERIIEEDEAIQSFEVNYNEEEAMDFVLGKVATEIFPVKVGQRMKLISKELNVVFEGDTAYGNIVKTFEGVLFIVASTDSLTGRLDSIDLDVYEKPFSTTITRNVVFVKVDDTDDPTKNWKLSSISLPVGGTLTENIAIESLTVYLPDGETLIIDSPLDYYFSRGPSFRRLVPSFGNRESVKVEVNIKSIYEEADYVTLTHGAIKDRKDSRSKRRFTFDETSERNEGGYYYRTYTGEWTINQHRGFKHAIVSAFPWGVIKDSDAAVETVSWGIPYFVK